MRSCSKFFVLTLMLLGCTTPPSEDVVVRDSATDTAVSTDTSVMDTSTLDVASDTGSTDASSLDVISRTDTGMDVPTVMDVPRDSSGVDAGTLDAGTDVPRMDATSDVSDGGTTMSWIVEDRTLMVGSVSRTFVLARPMTTPTTPMPIVVALHGDGGTGRGIRTSLGLESRATLPTLFVYPNAVGGTFEYYTDTGRANEAAFVTALINALAQQYPVQRNRVFLTGFSGGATMTNALGCRLGSTVIRGIGIHSGTLYPVNNTANVPDFTYTANGGVSCSLPPAMFVWGTADQTPGVTFAQGSAVRDNYRLTFQCVNTTTTSTPTPCVSYAGCQRPLIWCPIAGMGHSVWSNAGVAFMSFFEGLN